jgi:uncharacterized protein YoxC
VFVVLLSVLSMLMTAAAVTFVYTIDNHRVANERLSDEVQRLQAGVAQREAAATSIQQAAESRLNAASTRIAQLEEQLRSAQTQSAQLNGRLSAAELASKQLEAAMTAEKSKADGLVASNERLFQQLNEFRTLADNRIRQVAELSQSVSDLTNRLSVTERERRFLAEQLAEAQTRIERAEGVFRQYNIPADTAVAKMAAPDIRGVVRSRRDIAGVPYATISIGARADVSKGMEFSIVDRESGQFLGTLTIEAVEPNEAIGRLSGERLNEVRAGNEVRTQL